MGITPNVGVCSDCLADLLQRMLDVEVEVFLENGFVRHGVLKGFKVAVHVEASGLTLEGRLLHVEPSRHNGFGNIILQTSSGLVLVRGSSVQSIGERAESTKASAPQNTRKNGGEGKHAVL